MNSKPLALKIASSTLLSAFVLACSSGLADESGTDEGATVVEPNGTDNPGKVVVVVPNGALEKTEFDFNGSTGPVTHALGQPVTGLATGSYGVTLRTNGPTYSVTTSGGVRVEAGHTTTVTAGLLAIDARTAGLRVFGLGSDAYADIAIGLGDGKAKASADGTTFAALLGIRYGVSFGLGDGTEANIKAGEKTTVVLRSAPDRRVAHLVASTTPRAFPSHACESSPPVDEFLVSSRAAIKLAPGETIEFGAGPQSDNLKYYVETASLKSVDLPLGARGGLPAVTKFGRIDVDDVLVNATQPRVRGTYEISVPANGSEEPTSSILKCPLPTKTGVDVPFGKYVVTVSYQTVEAGMKKESYVVNVN